jgi:hypothetical protein
MFIRCVGGKRPIVTETTVVFVYDFYIDFCTKDAACAVQCDLELNLGRLERMAGHSSGTAKEPVTPHLFRFFWRSQ